jgi:hypothetical protein
VSQARYDELQRDKLVERQAPARLFRLSLLDRKWSAARASRRAAELAGNEQNVGSGGSERPGGRVAEPRRRNRRCGGTANRGLSASPMSCS